MYIIETIFWNGINPTEKIQSNSVLLEHLLIPKQALHKIYELLKVKPDVTDILLGDAQTCHVLSKKWRLRNIKIFKPSPE